MKFKTHIYVMEGQREIVNTRGFLDLDEILESAISNRNFANCFHFQQFRDMCEKSIPVWREDHRVFASLFQD